MLKVTTLALIQQGQGLATPTDMPLAQGAAGSGEALAAAVKYIVSSMNDLGVRKQVQEGEKKILKTVRERLQKEIPICYMSDADIPYGGLIVSPVCFTSLAGGDYQDLRYLDTYFECFDEKIFGAIKKFSKRLKKSPDLYDIGPNSTLRYSFSWAYFV